MWLAVWGTYTEALFVMEDPPHPPVPALADSVGDAGAPDARIGVAREGWGEVGCGGGWVWR